MSRSNVRSSKFAPALQVLEGRECPAGISLANGVLSITGSGAVDTVTVTQDDAMNQISVQDGVQTVIFFSHRVSTVNVGLDAGNDDFTYTLASDYTRMKHVNINLGADHDKATLDFGAGNSHALQANLYLSVGGADGDDNVRADFGDFVSTSTSPRLDVAMDLGNGNDFGTVSLSGRLGPSAVARFNLIGNSNDDNLYFSHKGDVDKTAYLDLLMDGGWGNDKVTMNSAGRMDGSYHCRLDGGVRGDDVVYAEMIVNAGSVGTLDVECNGGTGADQMGLMVYDNSGGSLVLARANLDGGAGTDTLIAATPNVQQINIP